MVDFKNGKIICDNGLIIDKNLRHSDLLAAVWEEEQFFTRPSYFHDLTHVQLRHATSGDGIEVICFEIPADGIIGGCYIYPTDCLPATFPEPPERKMIRKKIEKWLLRHQWSAQSAAYPWGEVRLIDDEKSGNLCVAVSFKSPAITRRRIKHNLRILLHRVLHFKRPRIR
ncbi:MAG: hypothetical protein IJW40_07790 [Clostridia bacterium]|nr:hypothetical protein [Clostridia bacterium]